MRCVCECCVNEQQQKRTAVATSTSNNSRSDKISVHLLQSTTHCVHGQHVTAQRQQPGSAQHAFIIVTSNCREPVACLSPSTASDLKHMFVSPLAVTLLKANSIELLLTINEKFVESF